MTKDKTTEILSTLDCVYGTTKDNFHHTEQWQLLVAIMLSAQSTDKQVEAVLPTLWEQFPALDDMANETTEEIEVAIRSIGLYKNKAKNIKKCCQQIIEEHDGQVPNTIEGLLSLQGVGRKTATLYLADAYGTPGVTVDTHVFRITKRIGFAQGKNPQVVEKELEKALPKDHWNRINFQLIYLGRAICKARKAECEICPITTWCDKNFEVKQGKENE